MWWIILIVVILALGGLGYWVWRFMRRDIDKAVDALIAKFIAKAIKKGDVWEEEAKKRIITKLQQLIKVIENINVVQ